jgi:hypothetical protein
MKVVPVTACFQRRDRDFRPGPLRAYGPRKFMKIAQSYTGHRRPRQFSPTRHSVHILLVSCFETAWSIAWPNAGEVASTSTQTQARVQLENSAEPLKFENTAGEGTGGGKNIEHAQRLRLTAGHPPPMLSLEGVASNIRHR